MSIDRQMILFINTSFLFNGANAFGSDGFVKKRPGETVLDPMAAAEEQMRSEEDKKRKAKLDDHRCFSWFRCLRGFHTELFLMKKTWWKHVV